MRDHQVESIMPISINNIELDDKPNKDNELNELEKLAGMD